MNKVRPNLFLVGAMKAGTTSLQSYLGEHPEIDFCVPKEPNYFGESGRRNAGLTSLEDYKSLFAAHRGRYSGDATARYLASSAAANEIYRYHPGAQILVILRNPIDRAYSHFWHAQKGDSEARSFGEVIDAELRESNPGATSYLAYGRYASQLRRYLSTFGGASVKVVLTEDLDADAQSVCRDIFTFLNLDPAIRLNTATRLNPSGQLRAPGLRRWITTTPLLRWIARSTLSQDARARLVWRLDAWLVSKRATPPVPQYLRSRIAAHYASEVRELRELLGSDLHQWADWPT